MVENVRRKVFWIGLLVVLATLSLVVPDRPFRMGLDLQGGTRLVYRFDFDEALRSGLISPEEAQDPYQLLTEFTSIIRERIDPQGVLEASFRPQGTDRIVIELPAIADMGRVDASAPLEEALPAGQTFLLLSEETPDRELAKFPETGGLVQISGDHGEKIEYASREGRFFDGLMRARQGTSQQDHPAGALVELLSTDPIQLIIENPGTMAFYIVAESGDMPPGTDLVTEEERAIAWLEEHPGRTIEHYNHLTPEEGGASLETLFWFPQKAEGDRADAAPEDRLMPVLLPERREWRFTGSDLARVYPAQDEMGMPAVGFEMKGARRPAFGSFTGANVENRMAIVLNGEVVVAPTLQSALTGSSVITGGPGGYTRDEVNTLVRILKSGSLRFKPTLEQKELVGATLGAEYVRRGAMSALVGLAVVLTFMVFFYRRLGIYASISLLINLLLLMGVMAFIRATLTLPGVAGIILTVGMAIDANILIYERMREERKRGRKLAQAAKDGFDNALSAIIDANLTTLITALILRYVGTGPVRGFATTLSIGILTSMFSALVITRVLVHFHIARGAKEFGMGRILGDTQIPFQRYARPAMMASLVAVIAGASIFLWRPDKEQLSIDFLGGIAVTVRTEEPQPPEEIRRLMGEGTTGALADAAVQPLLASGTREEGYRSFRITSKGEGEADPRAIDDAAATTGETQIARALAPVMQAGPVVLEIEGRAARGRVYFEAEHPLDDIAGALASVGLEEPRVEAVEGRSGVYTFTGSTAPGARREALALSMSHALEAREDSAGIPMTLSKPIPESSVVGAQVVGELRDKALLAILLSLFAVVLYIRVRFAEYSYGFAAVAALVHDVLITLGVVAVVNWLGLVEAEISLAMVAAFLTIIGYSLNDTIVVFDRIRENLPRMKGTLPEIVDASINQTLSRTILTSCTTLAAVLILFFFNYGTGSVLEGFAFALVIGIVIGTYSTIYVAGPVFVWLERRARASGQERPEKAAVARPEPGTV